MTRDSFSRWLRIKNALTLLDRSKPIVFKIAILQDFLEFKAVASKWLEWCYSRELKKSCNIND